MTSHRHLFPRSPEDGCFLSRRRFLWQLGSMVGCVAGFAAANLRPVRAAPLVRVAPPLIVRHPGCMATVSVLVTLGGFPPGTQIAAGGDILETDEPDGDPDPCVTFPTQSLRVPQAQPASLLLSCDAQASSLGLVQGAGPAADEDFSPNLVELAAQVWLRNEVTGEELGSWLSPLRVAVASTALAWTPKDQGRSSNMLEFPRIRPRSQDGAAAPLPLQACLP